MLTQVTKSMVFKTIRGINCCSRLSIYYRIILKIMIRYYLLIFTITVALSGLISSSAFSQALKENLELDEKVQAYLDSHVWQWRDSNVPYIDGKLLFDIIVNNNYKNALEIGTSTGHSGIWIAWALSKTGGKLITIEIDEGRHRQALQNFKEAGLSDYIDARLADAHELVKQLKGPFDFVFSDADKGWYKNYFIDVDPKLIVGGCFTAHNISDRSYSGYNRGGRRGFGGRGGQAEFLEYIKSLPNYETKVNSQGAGVSISYKKAEK